MAKQAKDESQLALARELKNIPCYDSLVPELKKARFRARAWAHKYNTYWPPEGEDDPDALTEKRQKDLELILGNIGADGYIEPPFTIDILDCGLVTIGDRVMVGPNVSIFAATHETEVPSRREDIEFTKPVTIGNDCWIGGHVVILPGVTIGKGCTIAASSVVTKDIPEWSIAMGSPAKVTGKVTPVDDVPE